MSEGTLQMDQTIDNVEHDAVTSKLESQAIRNFKVPETTIKNLKVMLGIGALAAFVGLVFQRENLWASLLVNAYYLIGLGLGAVFFICINYVAASGWSVVTRRVSEAMTGIIPIGFAGILITITLGY